MTVAIEGDLEDIESWLTDYGPQHSGLREGLFTIKDDPHDMEDYECGFCSGTHRYTTDAANSSREEFAFGITAVEVYDDRGRHVTTEYIFLD